MITKKHNGIDIRGMKVEGIMLEGATVAIASVIEGEIR